MAIYSKSPKALLLDEMNRLNLAPTKLNENNCIVGVPQSIPVTPEGYNTEVVVTGIQFRGYINSVTFRYRRLDFALLFKNLVVTIDAPTARSVYTGLANLNARYGLNLTQDDVGDGAFYDGLNFTIGALPGSYQYFGSFNARYRNGGYRLNDVVYDRNLDAYNHPLTQDVVSTGIKSGQMLSYGLDMTGEFNIVSVMADGPLGNGPNFNSGNTQSLVQTLVSMGFPSFDYSKASIATYNKGVIGILNPKYDKVAVISGIVDPNIQGPIYLQYNLL
jgi:hypothetical protein